MFNSLLPLIVLASVWASPMPQVASASGASSRAPTVTVASASSSPQPTVPYASVRFGLKYNDTEYGKRIHPFLREDLCARVVNETLIEGAIIEVGRCLNNSAPYPAQRNLFNLTTLNVTANYTGLIAPANQTTLCLSGKWHIPANSTDYATTADRQISLQKCNSSDVHQVWRYGIDSRVTNGTNKAYKLTLDDQKQCATVLKDGRTGSQVLVFSMYPCYNGVGSQLLMVSNGTNTPTQKIPGIPIIP